MNGLADRLLELKPEAVSGWIDRIGAVNRDIIEEVFDSPKGRLRQRLPEDWVSNVRAKFAIDFLEASRNQLVEIVKARVQTLSPATNGTALDSLKEHLKKELKANGAIDNSDDEPNPNTDLDFESKDPQSSSSPRW